MAGSIKVLDSWAVMAFFEGEPAAEVVESLIYQSIQGKAQLLMTTINAGEVWYSVARAQGDEAADVAIRNLCSLGIEIVPGDWELCLQAARFKSRIPVAYADCFAAALASLRDVELVTGDPELEKFQDQIQILLIGAS